MITKRTKAPDKNDKRYVHKNYGGNYLGILGSPSWFKGSILANCVGYAFARRQEIELELTGNEYTLVGIPRGRTEYKPTSAYLWYDIGKTTDGYDRSTNEPKIGAVCVWKNKLKNMGHVAIVEDITKDYIEISESGMGVPGYVFRTVKIYKNYCMITNFNPKNGKYTTSKHWNYKYINGQIIKADNNFLGYIYPPEATIKKPKNDDFGFKVGDKIIINSNNYKRIILAIDTKKDKPYKVGISDKKITGWYKASQIKKVEE